MLLRKIKAKFVSILLFSTSSDFSETMRVAVGEIIQIKIFEVVNVSWLFSCPRLISLNDFFFRLPFCSEITDSRSLCWQNQEIAGALQY